jgi:hypothetical protein
MVSKEQIDGYIADGRAKMHAALRTHPGAPLKAMLDMGEAMLRHLCTANPEDYKVAEEAKPADAPQGAATVDSEGFKIADTPPLDPPDKLTS